MAGLQTKVIFIGGFGRSGSTLIDIYLGCHESIFSLGELLQINRDSLKDELCSCKKNIGECDYWSKVISQWEAGRQLSQLDFEKYDAKFRLSLRNALYHFKSRFSKDPLIEKFFEDYRLLLNCISKEQQGSYVVDSSKNPFRLLLYKRLIPKKDIISLHIFRHGTRVLNSYKKPWKKDIEKGIEKDIPPRKTGKVMRKFFTHHIWTRLLSAGMKRRGLVYERLIVDKDYRDEMMSFIYERPFVSEVSVMNPGHLMAGNRLRLQNDIVFDGSLLSKGLKGKYVTRFDVIFSKTVNGLCRLLIGF